MIKDIPTTVSTNEDNFLLIAGPCAIEGEQMAMDIAGEVKEICKELDIPYIFKGSYRKANRSRLDSFTGIGDEKALGILAEVKAKMQLPVTTDIHLPEEAQMAADAVDVLQIPAFLCRQTDLLVAAAKTGKVVNVKKGQFVSAEAMQFAVQKVKDSGNDKVWLTERGSMFGYGDLVVDFRGIPQMQKYAPVVVDITHSLQQPNTSTGVTGGKPELISTIGNAAIAVGADAIFIETHPEPSKAKSDGANMLQLSKLKPLLEQMVAIRKAIKA